MLNDGGISCYIDNVCVNYVFYADDSCFMASFAIALQQLLNNSHRFSVIVDLNFKALKSLRFSFTPKPYKYAYQVCT